MFSLRKIGERVAITNDLLFRIIGKAADFLRKEITLNIFYLGSGDDGTREIVR
jgi:hypothetical protein